MLPAIRKFGYFPYLINRCDTRFQLPLLRHLEEVSTVSSSKTGLRQRKAAVAHHPWKARVRSIAVAARQSVPYLCTAKPTTINNVIG